MNSPSIDAPLRELRSELCRVGASLFARGYAHATAGNLSTLTADGDCLITPTDACLGALDADQLALVAPDGVQRSGARASKTLTVHRAIYAADTDARCVIGGNASSGCHTPCNVSATRCVLWVWITQRASGSAA